MGVSTLKGVCVLYMCVCPPHMGVCTLWTTVHFTGMSSLQGCVYLIGDLCSVVNHCICDDQKVMKISVFVCCLLESVYANQSHPSTYPNKSSIKKQDILVSFAISLEDYFLQLHHGNLTGDRNNECQKVGHCSDSDEMPRLKSNNRKL